MYLSVESQHGEECLLRHFHIANLLHSLLTFLLFLKQFSLAAYVATIAFSRHVLTHALYCLTGDNLGSYGCLNGNVELLSWYQFLEFLTHSSAKGHGIVLMCQCGKCIHGLSVEENVELCKFRRAEAVDMVVVLCVAFRHALPLVVEVDYYLAQWNHEMQLHTVSAHVLLVNKFSTLVEA